jgi:hypothetical protein
LALHTCKFYITGLKHKLKISKPGIVSQVWNHDHLGMTDQKKILMISSFSSRPTQWKYAWIPSSRSWIQIPVSLPPPPNCKKQAWKCMLVILAPERLRQEIWPISRPHCAIVKPDVTNKTQPKRKKRKRKKSHLLLDIHIFFLSFHINSMYTLYQVNLEMI